MKKCYTTVSIGLLMIGLSMTAQAALIDRGNGLIYDNVLDVTWLQDANYAATQYAATGGAEGDADGKMTWSAAQAWVAGLNYQGFTGWRLPTIEPLDDVSYNMTTSYNGTTDKGYGNGNVATELGYMFYTNLGYSSFYDGGYSFGSDQNSIFGSSLKRSSYFSGSEYSAGDVMAFVMSSGLQNQTAKSGSNYAWAVHEGDIMSPVPIPAAAWLFGSALAGLAGFTRMQKQR